MQLFSKYFQSFSNFVNCDDCSGKITSKSVRLIPVFIKNDLKFIKNRFFLVKKLEIQVIVFMTMLTRSSERIFNPMRYTGII